MLSTDSHIAIFRCSECLELIPRSGSPSELRSQRLLLVSDSRLHMDYTDIDDSMFMRWEVLCKDCINDFDVIGSPNYRALVLSLPVELTFDKLNTLISENRLGSVLKMELMHLAHFVGSDRPDV